MKEPDPKIDLSKLSPELRAIYEGMLDGSISKDDAVALIMAMPYQDPRDDEVIRSWMSPEARKMFDDFRTEMKNVGRRGRF